MGRGNLSSGAAIAVLSVIFFTWGGLTSLNDVLIPHLKAVFEMNYARTMLIQFTFFSTYLVMSMPSGSAVSFALPTAIPLDELAEPDCKRRGRRKSRRRRETLD